MRLIISDEIIEDLKIKEYSRNGYSCFVQEYIYNNTLLNLYIEKIQTNEENCPVNLYELIWTETAMSDCTFDYVAQLKNIRKNFNDNHYDIFKRQQK